MIFLIFVRAWQQKFHTANLIFFPAASFVLHRRPDSSWDNPHRQDRMSDFSHKCGLLSINPSFFINHLFSSLILPPSCPPRCIPFEIGIFQPRLFFASWLTYMHKGPGRFYIYFPPRLQPSLSALAARTLVLSNHPLFTLNSRRVRISGTKMHWLGRR